MLPARRYAPGKGVADLQASVSHHRASIELNPQIPWLADTDGRVTEISPRWAKLVGIPVKRALGEGWRTPVHPDDLPTSSRSDGGRWKLETAGCPK
ncbi:MAG: PAS domain S-box protein [Aurantimonas endophytica]|uniref:PAS domain S-box protein n=1 Tax=Aurantimonas endophytica TaxID=1522175 RepID=UPI0030016A12